MKYLLCLVLLFSGCAYKLDGLRPDELHNVNPSQFSGIEGWFALKGEVLYSKGKYELKPNLLYILTDVYRQGYPESENANAIYVKLTSDKMEARVKGKAGTEQALTFAYDDPRPGDILPYANIQRFCSQNKLLVRVTWSSVFCTSSRSFYGDTVFRGDERGLTVTMYVKYTCGPFWLFSNSETGEAQFFFPAVAPE